MGIIIKGETDHYELVGRETMSNLTRLQLDADIWIVNSVLACLTAEQAADRCLPEREKCVASAMAHAIARLGLIEQS